MDNLLNSEEIYLLINNDKLIEEYGLLDMYNVYDDAPPTVCSICSILITEDNKCLGSSYCIPCRRNKNYESARINKAKREMRRRGKI